MAGALLVAAAQPLVAEDTWWHLAIGRVYAASGPWLAADPFLHTAPGPPAPAAWASGLVLYGVERALGFTGLRALHALCVAAILAVAWLALHRASRSRVFASSGTVLFAALAAYRLFQLRPELVTLLATLMLLAGLARESRVAPTRARLAVIAVGFALWANLHGGFVLGLALLGAAALAVAVAARGRELGLAAAWLAAFAGSLVNPIGLRAHALYFTAGGATADLSMIVDEWAPLRLFALPVANRPPSLASWAIVWGLWLATPIAVLGFARARRAGRVRNALDPALLAVAVAGLVAPLTAVRLVWLGIAPLLAIGHASRALGARRAGAWSCAAAGVLVAVAFARVGDWPMISSGIARAVYARPYPPEKYYAHPVWFLRDSGLEGRVWNDYASGNFLAYWLAPRLRAFSNGSLNVPPAVFADAAAISARSGRAGASFTELLDRYAIDVFFAVGIPSVPRANQPVRYTTAHLEDTPGWRVVFRNVDSAVYLRDDGRNRANLERVAAYYARARVPFDSARGFDALAALRAAPDWSAAHGLRPADARTLRAAPAQRAALYALLGGYEEAARLDRALLRNTPDSLPTTRRLVWSLLHRGDPRARRAATDRLAELRPAPNTLASALVTAEQALLTLEPDDARALLIRLPLLTGREAGELLATFQPPSARTR